MMNEATLLESRVSKIEQDNRRLKLTVGALLLALAAVPLIGAVMPEQIPSLIQARAFEVIDENGVSRAVMGELGVFVDSADWAADWDRAVLGMGMGIHFYDENANVVWSTLCAPNC
jgi:hypothetical protein